MDLISSKEPIIICDVGASPIDKTDFIDILPEYMKLSSKFKLNKKY